MKSATISSMIIVTMYMASLFAQPVPQRLHSFNRPWQLPPLGFKWNIDDIPFGGWFDSLVLNEDGFPHFSYSEEPIEHPFSYDLHYANRVGGQWEHEYVAEQMLQGFSKLTLTSTNLPWIAYTACHTLSCFLYTANKESNNWNIQEPLPGLYPSDAFSIDLDSKDRPHLSVCGSYRNNQSALWHIYLSGSKWISETIDTVCWSSTSIRLDSQDHARISYDIHESRDLKYAEWTGSEWAIETVDSAGDVGLENTLALDSSDRPHIAYLESTTGSLKYAKWNGETWETQIVDQLPYPGETISLAVDSLDRAHIAYFGYLGIPDWQNPPKARSWYASWSGNSWSIFDVDLGMYPSLALDADDLPYIVYLSDYSKNFKYAQGEIVVLDKAVYLPLIRIK